MNNNNYLSWKEAYMLALNMLPKGHLQQSKAHVKSLHYVALPGQRVIPTRALTSRHLSLGGFFYYETLYIAVLRIYFILKRSSNFFSKNVSIILLLLLHRLYFSLGIFLLDSVPGELRNLQVVSHCSPLLNPVSNPVD